MTENAEAQADSLPITEHELAALTTLTDDLAGATSARLLGLEEVCANEQLVRAGFTTLLVRGLGAVEDDLFRAEGKGTVVAGILNNATDWLRIHFGDGQGEGITAIVRSPLATLFVEYDSSAVFNATPLDNSVDVLNLAGAFLGAGAEEPILAPPFTAEVTRCTIDGTGSEQITIDSADAWTLGDGTAGAPAALWPAVLKRLGYEGLAAATA